MSIFNSFDPLREKMHEYMADRAGNPDVLSNCCGAMIYEDTDICSWCKEHCEPMSEE
jgi:hypothetical protein